MESAHLEAYKRAVSGCGLADMTDHARLWAKGRDRIDLIHRMSTNDLSSLGPNQGRWTVLTTAVGRMVDRILVVNLGERALILGSQGMTEPIRRWLSGYIFYNDDVSFTDAAGSLGQWLLVGPEAARAAEALVPGAAALAEGAFAGDDGLWVGRDAALSGSFIVVGAPERLAAVRPAVLAAGAVEIGREVYEVLRIESGVPEFGHEIGEQYIPLEAGLWGDVSFSKGCYIGQEIIARMESRGKLAKTLTGLHADGPLTPGTTFAGGTLTSAAESPRFGWIGLAFLRPAEAGAGREFQIDGVAARVAQLPFRG